VQRDVAGLDAGTGISVVTVDVCFTGERAVVSAPVTVVAVGAIVTLLPGVALEDSIPAATGGAHPANAEGPDAAARPVGNALANSDLSIDGGVHGAIE